MGSIRSEVRDQHLSQFPDEEGFLKAYLHSFYVTWGRRRKAYGTELSVYFLNPESFMLESFGFEQEVMLVYSSYASIEPRAIQAAESFMLDDPAKGRVEKLTYFFVSEAVDTEDWVYSYTSLHQESRLIIPINANDLRKNYADPWFVRNKISKLLYGRDLFDFRLPLEKDTYFFGRSELSVNLFDAVKRVENRGIFGLRKTGKTSLLYKVERMLEADSVAEVFYYDCKNPSIRKRRWYDLLGRIIKDVSNKYKIDVSSDCNEESAADDFIQLIARIDKIVLLIFDEIEYISPVSIEDTHWHKDFLDFWQTFWACQSRHRKVSAMIAGVNPSVVEIDTFSGIQNPLFGIVSYDYLTGLTLPDTRNMIRTLGKRMGLKFEVEATDYLHNRYGGHPLLTRLACSVTNKIIKENNETRPVTISKSRLKAEEEQRDTEIVFYCRHAVSELKQFYPDEYVMLELLASGQIHDFVELAAYPEYTKHLKSYGLLTQDSNKRPAMAIPVIGRYVGLELARREGRQTLLKVVRDEDRFQWLEKRKESIASDLRLLETAIKSAAQPSLFGVNSFPKADDFMDIKVVGSETDFKLFIDVCNKCFVESIENYGASISKPKYFWQEIKSTYGGLFDALHRIKVYRHHNFHLGLTQQVSSELLNFLGRDLEGKPINKVKDGYFVLQQCVMDELLSGIQIEIGKVT